MSEGAGVQARPTETLAVILSPLALMPETRTPVSVPSCAREEGSVRSVRLSLPAALNRSSASPNHGPMTGTAAVCISH
jgi:hypothetical protein